MATNSAVKKLLYEREPIGGSQPYKIWSAWSDIRFTARNNEFINTFYIYFDKLKVILSPNRSYINLPYVYDRFLKFGDMDYSEWQKAYLTTYHHNKIVAPVRATTPSGTMGVIPYLQSIPLEIPHTHSGLIMILIDENRVLRELDDLSFDPGGGAYIALPNDQILTVSTSLSDFDLDSDIFSIHLETNLESGSC